MNVIVIGVDVSKGYVDVEFLNSSGTFLQDGGRFDDTAAGHGQLRDRVLRLKDKNDPVRFIVGLEASGGLERNWLKFFRELKNLCVMEVLLLNPLAVKKFMERNLRRTKTDKISARNIAEYLSTGRRRQDVEYEPALQGCYTLYRCILAAISRRVETQVQLQSLLPAVQPELVQFCRDGIPEWILELLIAYPTAVRLGRAKAATVSKIKQITPKRASDLIRAASQSVASQLDEHTAQAVNFLAEEIQEQNQKISRLKKSLIESLKKDPAVKIIDSIKGIAIWTAIVMRLEYGNMERFYSADAAVAYAGLDPRIDQSGDTEIHRGISRAGRIRIRAALYMPTLAAIRSNPIIKNFYGRLIANGKPEKVAIVACMRKLIHIIYACWVTGKSFDPAYQTEKTKICSKQQSAFHPLSEIIAAKSASLAAPISRREAKRRKAAAMPQKGISPLMRGPRRRF